MKSESSHPLPQAVLTTLSLLITVSIACTSYKSSGSSPLANSNATINQTSTEPINATAQDKPTCQLTLAGAPDIKGLRLGMTTDEVLALFPGSKDDAEVRANLSRPPSQFGESQFLIRPNKYESKDKFAGINHITFTLLDGRVSNFTVGYNGPEYSHVDQFVTKFVEGTSLPPVDQWAPYVGMDNSLKILGCKDFEIRVFIGGQGGNLNYVLTKDLEAEKKLQERYKKAEEKATPEAKK
jgi:hypothetical protein